MEIRKIRKAEMATALQLILETFLQFEAPDYSQQGIDSFYEFISNQGIIDSLEFFGAFDNNTLRGVIAANDNRKQTSHRDTLHQSKNTHRQAAAKL